MKFDDAGWGTYSELGAGLSGREVLAHKSDEGMKGYICRLFNHCDWYVMKGNMRKGLPICSLDIMGKHESEEGAKAALLVTLATL